MPKLTLTVGGGVWAPAWLVMTHAARVRAATISCRSRRVCLLVGVIMMSPSVNELGKRIKYSTFSESVNVERDRPALAGYRTAHLREGVVIIEIFERRDVTTRTSSPPHATEPSRH